MGNGSAVEQPAPSWWSWLNWPTKHGVDSHSKEPGHSKLQSVHSDVIPVEVQTPTSSAAQAPSMEAMKKLSGWERVRYLYKYPSMEHDCSTRVARMAFLTGFFLGGASTYAAARETYERSNVGRKYLSPSDAFKRRMDYAIVRFAKSGLVMGAKAAIISGSILVASTHVAAYRQRFSSWYLPAFSGVLAVTLHEALVGGVFTFPLGLIGSLKAVGLGVTSGLTLAAVVHLYALSMDKTVDDAYWTFKREYENDLRAEQEFQDRVTKLMKDEGYKWRGSAASRLRKLDEEKLAAHDA